MKFLSLLIFLFIGANTFAQVDTTQEPNAKFTSDKVSFDSNTNITELVGNLSFKTDLINLENGDKIIYNEKTKELVVSGVEGFTFQGTIKIAEGSKKNVLRYIVGENIAYLE